MRLDKFLKVSRLIKRRTVAKDASEAGRVWLNGREAKPSTAVKVGDEIAIQYGQKKLVVQITQIIETTKKEMATEMYTILREERLPVEPLF